MSYGRLTDERDHREQHAWACLGNAPCVADKGHPRLYPWGYPGGSGRVVLSDTALFIDGVRVLSIVTASAMALSDGSALGVEYTAACDICDGYGQVRGVRCAWCIADSTGAMVTRNEAFLAEQDLANLGAWCARQQTRPTADGLQEIADRLAPALSERRDMVSAPTERSPQVAA